MKKRTIVLILLMLILIAAAALFHSHNQYLLLQGEVDAPEVIVTSKAKGRVIERHVERGDDVKKGQLLLTLESPELQAQYAALQAAKAQAQAQLDLSINGTREETLRDLQASLAQANSQYQNATREFARLNSLSGKGYVSANELDSARKAKDVAFQQVQGAKARLEEGLHGDRIELRHQYEAALNQADQKLAEIQVQLDDLQVKAPVEGEVGPIPAEIGELFNAGSPLVSLIRIPQSYFIYNLREDILVDVKKGDKVQLDVPALGNKLIEAEIRYIAPKGDYATKRATRATGDFDLKTFEIRLYPLEPIEGLRPGMSVLWHWDK
ncbi:HlyD family secretion protein [Providencia heimbachae]|uniref:Membrane fusion component of a tripartite multidrug resistance system n=1 Tax=Providencia heimbachae ATCC 35613 TaxID=1354272 RepID=A0A1B7JVU1_9GAMM|nr:efflux RND transporter periplasmic adaptor subunit [Providencia heimbachae]MDD9339683.1 efflux RND transporter periplasmic adaptor subunit [Providencia heimbachae]NIH24221.1 HlyD family efflux transporter periplasmic adaptor subunit [Providencia heimbachae]OAT52021.1 membrane fusion component of a tripartite multidrug resistance system [Providencia heimbachae ATCC 35613]QCJ71609.1 secretion protein HlyD [Providencia heimbachae]SQH15333.1 putative efflux pump membrane fusion protein [Provide